MDFEGCNFAEDGTINMVINGMYSESGFQLVSLQTNFPLESLNIFQKLLHRWFHLFSLLWQNCEQIPSSSIREKWIQWAGANLDFSQFSNLSNLSLQLHFRLHVIISLETSFPYLAQYPKELLISSKRLVGLSPCQISPPSESCRNYFSFGSQHIISNSYHA